MAYSIEDDRIATAFGVAGRTAAGNLGVGLGGKIAYFNVDSNPEKSEQERRGYQAENYSVIEKDTIEFTSDSLLYVLPHNPTLIDFSRKKRLVETAINEGDGDGYVIENIGKEPYNIRIRGVLVDTENHEQPIELVKELMQVFEEDKVLEVSGNYFEMLDIESLYVLDVSIVPVPKFPDTVAYTITAKSHTPFELLIEE